MKHFPRSMNGLRFAQFSMENTACRVVMMVWKIKAYVSRTKFNGVSGNGGKDSRWTRPEWGDISASVSLMRLNSAKAEEGYYHLNLKTIK